MKYFFLLTLCIFTLHKAYAQNDILHIQIDNEHQIDPSTTLLMKSALAHAKDKGYKNILLEINTFGGQVNDADIIRQLILNFDGSIYAWVNKNAISAGALITLACDSIYMNHGASFGAVTVVNGQNGERAMDKYQSVMRSMMRTTAESKGRDPRIAEGMVDETAWVEGISKPGTIITFTTEEALKHNYCEGVATSTKDIYQTKFGDQWNIHKYEASAPDKISSIFLNPFLSSILMLVILGGLYFELQSPGIGFPIMASAIAALLYFIPHYIHGLAANWELLVFFAGIILLVLEMFVIPGFGIAGILGFVCLFGSLTLSMLDNVYFDFSMVNGTSIGSAIGVTTAAICMTAILFFAFADRITQSKQFKKISLQDTLTNEEGYHSHAEELPIINRIATTYTILRPSGKIMIDDQLIEAQAQTAYIEAGQSVKVIAKRGGVYIVRKTTT